MAKQAPADFDPWAGKSLGEPDKPQGFDEFWAQQESIAKGGPSAFLEKQESIVGSGPSPGGAPRGRGRGRGRFQRYSVVEPRAPRARPSHFVAIRLYSRMIRRNVEQMQKWFVDKDPRFERCIVPVRKIHSSLLLTAVPHERREEAKQACHEAGLDIRAFLGDQPVKLTCSGVGSFNGQVLFARIRTEPHEVLQAIHDALARAFMRHGFPVLDETAKSWLDDGEEPHAFKAHASFIKVSKAMAHSDPMQKREFRSLRVTEDDLDAWKDVFFGTQLCHEFELLDMIGSTRDGYYPCMQLERFNDRPVGLRPHSLSVKLAAGPLRMGHLRVESGDAGAGLEMSACPAGYLVEKIEEWPGQPDLREGDVIVAIGGTLLLELEESDLEKRFGEHFKDGAAVIAGPWTVLQKLRQTSVRGVAERLLRPWQAASEAVTDVESDTVSVSMYTEGGTRLRGKRYQLRTVAESFAPDPLSQPGGDPWAQAAEHGYVHPEYTGWGTRFLTRRATKVDSSHFRRQATATRLDAEGVCRDEEKTAVHARIRKVLREARTHAVILKTVADNRSLLSVSNRIFALARLQACGRLPDELQKDERMRSMLSDLEDDLEAVVEAGSSLPPALLGSLSLALGRLGLRRPELSRSLAMVARRVGIWTFADEEAAALLEGFSRTHLLDEVLFQEAARLLVARVGKVAPRLLVTMLTAFACSNVATEQLFFAAGDAVVAAQRHYTSGQLAELADAFSRVRARHALLLDVVPAHFGEKALRDPRQCSIEALVKLFSAYVDVRQEMGPDGYREELAAAICGRKKELSARLMRQVLQAAARARWPNVALLDIAPEVAARDPNQWEVEAMHNCFAQLRVLPPDGFPSGGKDRHPDGPATAVGTGAGTEPPAATGAGGEPGAGAGPLLLRRGRLNVGAGGSAGVEMSVCDAGYLVEGVSREPGQPDLAAGDVVVAIGGSLLLGLEEDAVEERFARGFRPEAPIVIGAADMLRGRSLEDIRRAAESLIEASDATASSAPRAAPRATREVAEPVSMYPQRVQPKEAAASAPALPAVPELPPESSPESRSGGGGGRGRGARAAQGGGSPAAASEPSPPQQVGRTRARRPVPPPPPGQRVWRPKVPVS